MHQIFQYPNLTEVFETTETDSGTPNWGEIALRLDGYFAESNEAGSVTPKAARHLIYPDESPIGVHEGLGVLQGHVDTRGNTTFTIEG